MTEVAQVPVPAYPDLAGKVAVVTGGSRGIGAATCRLLASNGVRVAVVARAQPAIDRVVAQITAAGGEAIGQAADCTRWSAIEAMRAAVEATFGPADILVAFAGGFGAYTPAYEIAEDEWHAVIASNLTATFLTIKSFLPVMIERRRGSIVTMASCVARSLDVPLTASYAAAKAGIIGLTRHVAKEVGPYGIRANCVAPGTTRSERLERIMPAERAELVRALSPLGRLGVPEDTGLATLFLASDAASWVTGVTLDVAGGRVMV
jgi:3-oxoacyl-[acyl-carrier protein] reductase